MTNHTKQTIILAATILITALFSSSCSKDDDDPAYSTLTAEFVMLHTKAAKTSTTAQTDKDQPLTFATPLTVSWATKADTTYRALLYYNKVEGSTTINPQSAYGVAVLNPRTPEQARKWSNEHDPLDIAAAWRSSNGKWLNFNIALKTGVADTDQQPKHTLGIVCDSIVNTTTGRLLYCSLCHGQNNIPTYYTVTSYASIPIENPTDSFIINAVTWKGKITRQY